MAGSAGKLANFQVANSAGTLVDISAYTDTSDLDQKLASLETTTFGASAKTFVAGLTDGNISIGGVWDPTLDSTLNGTIAALANGTLASAAWQFGPKGTAVGGVKYTGNSIITDYKTSEAVAGIIKWTASLQVSGAITRGSF